MGQFKLTSGLYNWNYGATDSKFVDNILFYVLLIVPVYEIVFIGDFIIFNLIEFWSGSNPLSLEEGESEEQLITYKGKSYLMKSAKNQIEVYKLRKDGTQKLVSSLVFDDSENCWSVVEGKKSKKILSMVDVNSSNSSFSVYDEDNNTRIVSLQTQEIINQGNRTNGK